MYPIIQLLVICDMTQFNNVFITQMYVNCYMTHIMYSITQMYSITIVSWHKFIPMLLRLNYIQMYSTTQMYANCFLSKQSSSVNVSRHKCILMCSSSLMTKIYFNFFLQWHNYILLVADWWNISQIFSSCFHPVQMFLLLIIFSFRREQLNFIMRLNLVWSSESEEVRFQRQAYWTTSEGTS